MPSTFSPSLRIELIGTGEKSGVWGVATNNNLGALLEQAIVGSTEVSVTLGDVTLTSLNGVLDQARSLVLIVTGTPGVTRVITIPNAKKPYTVRNISDSTVQIKTASGAAYNCPTASESYLYCDGANGVTGRTITDGANTILANPAPYNSPAFTGIPTAPTAAPGTNTTQLATTAFVQAASQLAVPSGVILPYGGAVAPTGFLLCNGVAVSRTTYSLLFSAIGTAFGAGDGSTTFNLPNMQGNFPVGAGGSYAVGATGGANSVTLLETQIPAHTHSGTTANTDVAHTHTFTSGNQSADHTHSGTTATASIDHTHTGTTGNQSADHSHTFSGTVSSVDINHVHGGTTGNENQNHSHSGSTGFQSADHAHAFSAVTAAAGNHQHMMRALDVSGASGGDNPDAFFSGDGGSFDLGNTATAGSHSHLVSGGTGGVNANHYHDFSTGGISNNHTHNFSTGGMNANNVHSHTYSGTTSGVSVNHTHSITTGGMNSNVNHSHSITTGVQSSNHTHSGTTNSTSINHNHTFTTGSTGGGLSHENRPPYVGLTFIIKT